MNRFELDDPLYLEPRDVFDAAIVGVAERAGGMRVVAYDTFRCIVALMESGDMSEDEAREYFEFNTLGAWMGEATPVFVTLGI